MSNPKTHIEPLVIPLHDDNPYLLHSPLEITYVLNDLVKKHPAVTAYYDNEHSSTTLTILHIEADKVWFDLSQDEEANPHMQQSPQIICVTNLDRVQIQFDCETFKLDSFENRPAFVTTLPTKLLKLQRRDYYRLPIPQSQKLKCVIPLPNNPSIEAEIVNISLGGIGIIGYPLGLLLEWGTSYDNCAIHLPGTGIIVTTLQICSSYEYTLRNGTKTHRSGCKFTDLQPAMEVSIQRYITQQEREYRMKMAERGGTMSS